LAGIARFYKHILGAPSLPFEPTEDAVSIIVSPQQTLTFKYAPAGGVQDGALPKPTPHEDLERDEQVSVVRRLAVGM